MAEGTFKKMMIVGILSILFLYLMLFFAIDLGGGYDKAEGELGGNKFNLSGINTTLQGAKSTAETWQTTFTKQKFQSTAGFIVVIGIFKLATTMFDFILTPFGLVLDISNNVFHLPPIVSNIILFLIIVAMIFGIWRLIKTGD